MSLYVTSEQILKNHWNIDFKNYSIPKNLPDKEEWLYKKDLVFNDIRLWEKIYYEPGILGIYAAYDPYAEFYGIIHNLEMIDSNCIETFYGKTAEKEVIDRAKEFGIELPTNQIWIDYLTNSFR